MLLGDISGLTQKLADPTTEKEDALMAKKRLKAFIDDLDGLMKGDKN